MKSRLRSTLVDCRCGFLKDKQRLEMRIKECNSCKGKGGRPWRQRTRIWTGLLPKGHVEELHFIIHPFIHLSSLYLLSFYLGPWAQSYFTSSFKLLFPVLYGNSYPGVYNTICYKHRDLTGGIGGTKGDQQGSSVSLHPSQSPVTCTVEAGPPQGESWTSNFKKWLVAQWVWSKGEPRTTERHMQPKQAARNKFKTNVSSPKYGGR